jgi:hypothetical protein
MPVVEAGEGIPLSEVNKLFGRLPFPCHVFVEPQTTDELVITITHGVSELREHATVRERELETFADFESARNLRNMTRERV